MQTRTRVSILLAASVWLAGCATKLEPRASAQVGPEIVAPVLDGSSLLAVRVVPDERAIQLLGEFTAEGRAAFEEARSARIDGRPRAGRDLTGIDIAHCLIKGLVIVCPLALAIRGVALGTVNGVRYVKASARAPRLLIPEKPAFSLATRFKEHATGAALAERTSRHTIAQQGTGAEHRLVVRMKAVDASQDSRNFLVIRLIAEAQAFASAGVPFTLTEHVYAWTYGPLSGWTENEDKLVRQAFDEGLDALAASIASTYMGSWESHEPAADPAASARRAEGLQAPAPEPTTVAIPPAPAAASSLPVAGDSWTYRLTEPRGRSQPRTHRVDIESAVPEALTERQGRAAHRNGSYLVDEADVVVFSPYLAAFDSTLAGLATAKIQNLDSHSCGPQWFCSTSARVAGRELVRVPAGEFEAIKLEVNQAWTPRAIGTAYPSGARTLTIWYSPQTKRAVKFSSRGSAGAHFKTDFDLDLEDYKLNLGRAAGL